MQDVSKTRWTSGKRQKVTRKNLVENTRQDDMRYNDLIKNIVIDTKDLRAKPCN